MSPISHDTGNFTDYLSTLALILWKFARHRKEINEFLDSDISFNRSNYRRIVLLSCMDAIVTFPLTVFSLLQAVIKYQAFSVPWPGWDVYHADIHQIVVHTPSQQPKTTWSTFCLQWNLYVYAVCALVFFVFFGFTDEMFSTYRSVLHSVLRSLGFARACRPKAATHEDPEPIRFERPSLHSTTDLESSLEYV